MESRKDNESVTGRARGLVVLVAELDPAKTTGVMGVNKREILQLILIEQYPF